MKRQLFSFCCLCALLVLSVSCGRRSGSGEGPLVLDIASAVGAGEVCESVCSDMFEVAGWTTIGTEDSVLLAYPQIFGYKDGEIYLYDGMSETFFRVLFPGSAGKAAAPENMCRSVRPASTVPGI